MYHYSYVVGNVQLALNKVQNGVMIFAKLLIEIIFIYKHKKIR